MSEETPKTIAACIATLLDYHDNAFDAAEAVLSARMDKLSEIHDRHLETANRQDEREHRREFNAYAERTAEKMSVIDEVISDMRKTRERVEAEFESIRDERERRYGSRDHCF